MRKYNQYATSKRPWGDRPSELALITASYLGNHPLSAKEPKIIDIGCGYGRDAFYLSSQLGMPVLGIDNSEAAIQMATDAASGKEADISFRCCDFKDLDYGVFDILFASNFYHVLRHDDRDAFRQIAQRIMRPRGILFLNNLSVNDCEEYGKGVPVPDEPNSFIGNKYLHFCTREELIDDFGFLDIQELYEHSYDEPHEKGPTHCHTSWILIGELAC
jgi:SAM-dependent methyltransferase